MDDLDKYALDQARMEVDHTRSWPTKILAFFAAINAGVVTAFLALRETYPALNHSTARLGLTVAIVVLLIWALCLIVRNHLSYLRYRNMQIRFQKNNEAELVTKFSVPDEWFREHRVSLTTRWQGWGFYAYLLCLVTAASFMGLWQ